MGPGKPLAADRTVFRVTCYTVEPLREGLDPIEVEDASAVHKLDRESRMQDGGGVRHSADDARPAHPGIHKR